MYEVMLALSVVVYLAVVAMYVRSGLVSMFHPVFIYLAFHGFVFVLRPIVVDIMGYNFIYSIYQFMPSLSDRITALIASNLGLLSFAFFSIRSGNVPMIFRDSPAQRVERNIMRRTLPAMLAVSVPLGVYSFVTGIDAVTSGVTSMVMKNGYRVNTTGSGYLTDAMLLLVPVCGLFAWYFRFRLFSFVPLVVFFLLKASSGGRGAFVIAVVSVAYFYFYDKKIRLPGARLVLLTLAVGVVFNFIGQDRGYALREAIGLKNQYENINEGGTGRGFLEGMDFASMEYVEYVVYVVPQRSGTYDYFLANLQLLTEPIPRALWPDKPVGAPIKLIDYFAYGNPMGMAVTLPGNGWFELGWIGVILWCGLWGWALGKFYRWFVSGPQDAITVSFYMVSLPVLLVGFRDGALLTVVRQGVFYVAPVVMMIGIRKALHLPTFAQIQASLGHRAAQQSQSAVPPSGPRHGPGKANRLRLIAAMAPKQNTAG